MHYISISNSIDLQKFKHQIQLETLNSGFDFSLSLF